MSGPFRHDVFGRPVRLPGDFSAVGKVSLVAQAARALEDGVLPSPEAGAFVGTLLARWLRTGVPLERLLGIARRGSHVTAQRLHAELESGCAASSSMNDTPSDLADDADLDDPDEEP